MVRRTAESLDLNLHICSDPDEVERRLFCHRYDGLILDHDETSERIVRTLRQSPSSKSAIAIDIHDESVNLQTVFGLGANFEMVYPLTVDRCRRTLQLAMGLMMLGRRRYYRHPVEIPARIFVNGAEFDAVVSNVSEQGIGLRCDSVPLQSGEVRCSFDLPDNSSKVAVEATVVWADKTGQAGCRINQFSQGGESFAEWISRLFYQGITNPAITPSISRSPAALTV
jgi:hypothetical protein